MHPRGRSRDVSSVALARQASEERRRNRTSIMKCYPLPSDPEKQAFSHFYLSPPSLSSSPASLLTLTPPDPAPLRSHPRSRVLHQDTSHAPIDPRESPFSAQAINSQPLPYPVHSRLSSPLPSTPLVEKPALQVEVVERARVRARAKRRYETLARAEQVFTTILERSRRERVAALLMRARKEDELMERERVTREFEGLERERDRRRTVSNISHVQRSGFRVLSRVPPPVSPQPRHVPERFTYPFPVPSTTLANTVLIRQRQGSMKTRLGLATLASPNATNAHSVSFDDIRASIGSVLFPIVHGESVSGRTRRESELLGTLLEPVRWEEGERRHPRSRTDAWTSRVPETVPECKACASVSLSLDGLSVPSPQTSSFSAGVSPSPASSRPISWLSFGMSISSINAQTYSPSAINHLPSASGHPSPQHSCGGTRWQSFVAVDVNDSPLGNSAKPFAVPVPSVPNTNIYQEPTHQRSRRTSFSERTWLAMQSIAARLQHVYVTATAATLTHTQDARTLVHLPSDTFPRHSRRPPSGWRAQWSDVVKFTQTVPHAERDAVPYLVFYLVELETIGRSPHSAPDPIWNLPTQDHMAPTSTSVTLPPTYHDADRHIFSTNPVHLLSRAQINSWRFRGAPGAMPPQVICRPELFYRIEPAGSPLREAKSGSALKWGWRVIWDADDHVEC
ncbi:hypothetical protein F5148DRAFT_1168382 [Russula earlei]|uniref:Uncharacterized protein n=1 Tax=Russula earlei TaxID=71964 RepID=A0ACC0UKW1_9AGAM|nr:hypothetical protein F5148DRAFT_1168382 [Russula earlei]